MFRTRLTVAAACALAAGAAFAQARGGVAAGVREAYKADQALREAQAVAAQMEVLASNQEILDKRLAALEGLRAENAALRAKIDEMARAQDALREQISIVSREQQRQRQEIVDDITRRVEALYKANPPPPPPSASSARGGSARPPRQIPSNGYEHIVEAGQTFAMIAREYDCCTVQDIQDANPDVDPRRLRLGQKLFIPDMTSLDGKGKGKKPRNNR